HQHQFRPGFHSQTDEADLFGESLHATCGNEACAAGDLRTARYPQGKGIGGRRLVACDAAQKSATPRSRSGVVSRVAPYPAQHIQFTPLLSSLTMSTHSRPIIPNSRCIHEIFEAQVDRSPDNVAVVIGSQRLTYRELNERANQLAHFLRNLGVQPDVLVGICVDRSLQLVVGLLGILKAGGTYVPIDPQYPPER